MATGIQISPPSGITIGTTAIDSGVDTRVLFQQGGVVQQDANFTFDSTLKRLTLKAVGTNATDIPFAVQNSAGTANIMQAQGDNKLSFLSTSGKAVLSSSGGPIFSFGRDFSNQEVVRIVANDYPGIYLTRLNTSSSFACGTVADGISMYFDNNTGHHFQIQNSFHNVFQVTGNPNSASSSFRLGSIGANTNFFNLYGPNAGGTGINATQLFNVNTNGNVGIGMVTTGARLDVKAQGALSTDIAFRVRNSADTANIFTANGDGTQTWFTPVMNVLNSIKSGTFNIIQYGNDAFGNIALGYNSSNMIVPTTTYNTVLGANASSGANSGFAIGIGWGSIVNGTGNICIGRTRTIGNYSIKIGYDGGASSYGGTNSIHLGRTVSGNNIEADNVFMTYFNSQSSSTLTRSNGSFGLLGQQAYILQNGTGIYGTDTFMGNGGNTLVVRNHPSVPSTNIVDSFQQYSADIVAGNAAPHFRTENGSIIKLYKETAANVGTGATFTNGSGTVITEDATFGGLTLSQIAKALGNLGLVELTA